MMSIGTPGGVCALVLASGDSGEFQIVARDPAGTPMVGADIVFIGPDTGPTGEFQGATEPAYHVVKTDAEGVASATWVAGMEPGSYYIEAAVGDSGTSVPCAVTQGRGSSPMVDAATAAMKVQGMVTEGSRMYGPHLLIAGDEVGPSTPTNEPRQVTMISEPTWMFWIDTRPDGKWEHDAKLLLIDAEDPAAEPVVTDMRWWPLVTTSTGDVEMLPPSDLNERTDTLEGFGSGGGGLRAAQTSMTKCAIVIHGPPERFLRRDAERMRDFFKDTLMVDHVYTKTPFVGSIQPATLDDLSGFLDVAKMDGCKKIYLYITSHGYNSGHGGQGIQLADPDDLTKKKATTHKEIAELLESKVGGMGTEVCIIIDACYAEPAISVYQHRGFTGGIAVASDYRSESGAAKYGFLGLTPGSYYTDALLSCWEDFVGKGQTPTLQQVHDWALANSGNKVNVPGPRIGTIRDTTLALPLPTVTIAGAGMNGTGNIAPPAGLMGIPEPVAAEVTFHGGVARLKQVNGDDIPVLFTPNGSGAAIMEGLTDGLGAYTVEVRANGLAFRGTGIINVGNVNPGDPNAATHLVAGDKVIVAVLVLGGRYFPRWHFRIGNDDGCDTPMMRFDHWHGDTVFPIALQRLEPNFDRALWTVPEGAGFTDPADQNCGYGKVKDVPTKFIIVPKSMFDTYVMNHGGP